MVACVQFIVYYYILLNNFIFMINKGSSLNRLEEDKDNIKFKKIEEVYDEVSKKLRELGVKRKGIIRGYIKELEEKKVNAIRASLGL